MTVPAEQQSDGDVLPWERQPGESARAFEAFTLYRDAGPERSQRAVARRLGKSGALIGRWSSAHRWVLRADAWDTEQDRQWRAQMTARRRRAVDRHVRTAELAQSKVAQRLIDLDPAELTVTELTRLLDVTVRIERDALGEPIRHEVTGAGGDPLTVQVAEFTAMGAEQRRRAIGDIVAAVRRRVDAAAGIDDDDE
jgi:hypothetical protein